MNSLVVVQFCYLNFRHTSDIKFAVLKSERLEKCEVNIYYVQGGILYFGQSCSESNRLPGKKRTNNKRTMYVPEISHFLKSINFQAALEPKELQPAIQKCFCYILMYIGPARALIGQKPMFYQSVKHRHDRKSVFYCFSRVKSISQSK